MTGMTTSARRRGSRQSAAAFRTTQLLTNFAKKSADGMLTTDVDGTLTWANRAAGMMLGWSVEELVGQHISAFYAPDLIYRCASLRGRLLSGETLFDAGRCCDATVVRSRYRSPSKWCVVRTRLRAARRV